MKRNFSAMTLLPSLTAVFLLCGCGPTKDELLSLAPYLTAAVTAVSCLAEFLNRRVKVYSFSFLIAAAFFFAILALDAGGNDLFLFSVIMMPFIVYAAALRGLLRLVLRRLGENGKGLMIAAFSSFAVSQFYCVFVTLNAKPDGSIGDATADIFGWPFFLLEAAGNLFKAVFGG